MSRQRHTVVGCVPPRNRVVRYKVDQVGNDLTAVLLWCDTHHQPVWVYGDDSFECPHDLIVQVHDDNHNIVTPPWEPSTTEQESDE